VAIWRTVAQTNAYSVCKQTKRTNRRRENEHEWREKSEQTYETVVTELVGPVHPDIVRFVPGNAVVTAWISWVLPSGSTSTLSTSRSSLRILGRGSGRHSVEKLDVGFKEELRFPGVVYWRL
jgi:hypothetical protein